VVCAVAFACAVSPALAADDPLLSGYSGPGGGEQVVIGSSVLPPKNGNGSIRSNAPAVAAPTQANSTSGGSGSGKKSSPQSSGQAQPQRQTPVIAAKPTYPNKVSSASGLPLSSSDLLMIAGALVAAALVAYAGLRLRRSPA
jgi:hypothetical protein